jgi:hypothetical protein
MPSVPVALLSHQDFRLARQLMPELESYAHYDDWLDCRHGLMMGLAMAGVETSLVSVTLADFHRWCVEHDQLPTEEALDAFALASDAPPFEQAMEPPANKPFLLAL